jgi:hypothetical protein
MTQKRPLSGPTHPLCVSIKLPPAGAILKRLLAALGVQLRGYFPGVKMPGYTISHGTGTLIASGVQNSFIQYCTEFYRVSSSFAAATTCSGSKPNFFWSSLPARRQGGNPPRPWRQGCASRQRAKLRGRVDSARRYPARIRRGECRHSAPDLLYAASVLSFGFSRCPPKPKRIAESSLS